MQSEPGLKLYIEAHMSLIQFLKELVVEAFLVSGRITGFARRQKLWSKRHLELAAA